MNLPSGGDKYRILRPIGSGGMGVVYEAWDLRLERRVAVKFLHPHLTAGEGSAARLEREARNAAKIEHPNVVRVHHIDTIGGQLAIEMQYIDGAPLGRLLAEGVVSPEVAAELLRQILEALAACHAHGVIHCDLKPGNLLVTAQGHLYLTDFGISRAMHPAAGGNAAESAPTGPLWGTPRYTPPEAWSGGRPTARWDLYSAGAVIHEALSGAPRFDVPTPEAVMHLKLGEDLPPIGLLAPGLSTEFAALVDGLTAHKPDQRPASAREALALLQFAPECRVGDEAAKTFGALYQGLHAADRTTKVVAGHAPARRRFRAWYLVAGLAVFFSATALYFVQGRNAVSPSQEADSAPEVTPQKLDSELFLGPFGVCFAYDDGVHGKELWYLSLSNGAVSMVSDITPGLESSNPHTFLRRGPSDFVFAASTPEFGEELWYGIIDNTARPDAVRLIKDVMPGRIGSDPVPVAQLQAATLFEARTITDGHELWITNTYPAQTALLADLVPGPDGSIPQDSRLYPDETGAYMVAYGGDPGLMRLWRYELASNAVREIAPVHADTLNFGTAGGILILNNHDEAHGMELWVYDPSRTGIQLLADLWSGPESSGPGFFYTWRGKVYFRARTPNAGVELWCTDGTAEGTYVIKDINPGPGDSDPYGYVETKNALFFRAKDDAHGQELWMTDGTAEGTLLAADVFPGGESSTPYNMVAQGKQFYFSANDGEHGEELWMLDLADPTNTSRLVKDLRHGAAGSEPHSLKWWTDTGGIMMAWTALDKLQLVKVNIGVDTVMMVPIELP